jgi:hypothetical protein
MSRSRADARLVSRLRHDTALLARAFFRCWGARGLDECGGSVGYTESSGCAGLSKLGPGREVRAGGSVLVAGVSQRRTVARQPDRQPEGSRSGSSQRRRASTSSVSRGCGRSSASRECGPRYPGHVARINGCGPEPAIHERIACVRWFVATEIRAPSMPTHPRCSRKLGRRHSGGQASECPGQDRVVKGGGATVPAPAAG